MRKYYLIALGIISIVLAGCTIEAERIPSPYYADVQEVSYLIDRYENVEVICYTYNSHNEGGIWCMPKQLNK